jgi:hypothetical protein
MPVYAYEIIHSLDHDPRKFQNLHFTEMTAYNLFHTVGIF